MCDWLANGLEHRNLMQKYTCSEQSLESTMTARKEVASERENQGCSLKGEVEISGAPDLPRAA